MIQRLKKSLEEKDQGFTLIELLVVIVIVGILAAIAIPIFLNQRQKAVDAGIESDLKAAATAQETYYTDNQTYATSLTELVDSDAGFKVSKGNEIEVIGDADGYCITGTNDAGSDNKFFWYDSLDGGLVVGTSAADKPAGACA
ncbi:type IV pilin protein [Nocardioides mangrovi]|uniref:Prepilin-type N-terminal cleavage/methylation domain-containing protein n=1 Tax=Nocardioides mangrovi TaxID=2874580 RepID=A0ABS7UG61_9ACTN|nr:prepilin-type N-terminal cleavage/methylation domain-containing protein [Nocardioides mangrovi]MBZ5740018.1 prepilin-type N-terminal cleavage/methylation domain-containing protein [Nocardioides mangrovi]MBZ5740811.1 prepilin-type N-terminal cleavage/methylation domain-containing protein [Nocardioides mangrovi]